MEYLHSIALPVGVSLVTAILTVWAIKLLFGPRLEIVPHEADYGLFETPEVKYPEVSVTHRPLNPGAEPIVQRIHSAIIGEASYIRIGVRNVGRDSALKCQGYLTGVEVRRANNTFAPLFFDAIPLLWSYSESDSTVDIPKGIVVHLDVAVARHSEDGDTLVPRLSIVPPRYANLFDEWSLHRLTIVVTAQNAKPITSRWCIEWKGKWNRMKVSQDQP